METNGKPVDEIQQLQEENAKLREELAQLRAEHALYHRAALAWAKQYHAAQPVPTPEELAQFVDAGPLLEELLREPAER
jgi:hypothetical protein